MVKAVFFDFNGTLYIDHDINKLAWEKVIKELCGNQIDFEDFYKTAKMYMNYQIITMACQQIGKKIDEETLDYYCKHKEVIYRQECLDQHRNQINKGGEDVLNYLKQNNVPVILCTSSIKSNVDFYFENLNLQRWFNPEQTVYDTGEYSSKVEMYLQCAARANVDIKDTVIFEDSPKSIKEAIETGCEKIVIIKRDDSPSHNVIKQCIEDFSKLDYSIFN